MMFSPISWNGMQSFPPPDSVFFCERPGSFLFPSSYKGVFPFFSGHQHQPPPPTTSFSTKRKYPLFLLPPARWFEKFPPPLFPYHRRIGRPQAASMASSTLGDRTSPSSLFLPGKGTTSPQFETRGKFPPSANVSTLPSPPFQGEKPTLSP